MSGVLVTGAAGFIGAHVVARLLVAGQQCTAAVRRRGSAWRLAQVAEHAGFSEVEAELCDPASLSAMVARVRPDICIHLAWPATPGEYLTSPANLTALSGSLHLVQELLASGCRQVVIAGTCAEYAPLPRLLREDDALGPQTLYGAAKCSLQLIARQLCDAAGARLAWGRVFYLYGPLEDERRAVPALIRALQAEREFPATAGTQQRDYLAVADVAEAFVTLALRQGNGLYNISSGHPLAMRTLMETVGGLLGRTQLIRFGTRSANSWDPDYVAGDNRRLAELGWRPRLSLADGLAESIAYWTERRG